MKISMEEVGRALQIQSIIEAAGKRPDGNGGSTAVEGHAPASSVEVSGKAQEIQRVKKLVDNTPDVREELVQSLKERIENGTYNVSGADIADLIVRRSFADRIR
jgi:negative regulator of flagellin synthesis FlgM